MDVRTLGTGGLNVSGSLQRAGVEAPGPGRSR